MLARNIGVKYKELEPLLMPHNLIEDIDRDEVWWKIKEYVSHRLAMLLTVNSELNKQLQKQRVKRVQRLERFKKVYDDGQES